MLRSCSHWYQLTIISVYKVFWDKSATLSSDYVRHYAIAQLFQFWMFLLLTVLWMISPHHKHIFQVSPAFHKITSFADKMIEISVSCYTTPYSRFLLLLCHQSFDCRQRDALPFIQCMLLCDVSSLYRKSLLSFF